MNFSVYTNDLVENLKPVVKCAAVKPNVPVLSAVKITADQSRGHLIFHATDFNVSAMSVIPASIYEGGEVCVDAKYLLDVAAKLPEATVTFVTRDNFLNVNSGGSIFDLLTFNTSDFPTPKFSTEPAINIRANVFKDALNKTLFAVSKGIDRPVFTGVNIRTEPIGEFGTRLRAFSTNAHRIAAFSAGIRTEDNVPDLNIVVPAKALQTINGFLDDDPESTVSLVPENKMLGIKFDNLRFKVRLIDGEFPTPEKTLVDESRDMEATFFAAEIKPVLESAKLVAKSTEYNVVTLEFGDNEITVSAQSNERGNFSSTISATCAAGLERSFNVDYLLDFVRAADCNKIRVKFGADEYSPIELCNSDEPDRFTYVVTPLRM